ncbi:response regulator [Stenotrophomonas maltophilia]|uniref:response regulator n=1 Tax=Stenotrophomonas maltophilia TaxID=40324 RepID=UPI000DA72B11|nr:response regulator [Stenotrophomonas maltophilia]MBH1513717.1 response regulator [Stenotrophomonas maltophilia]MBH1546345.1 response regulator [Stenotrophomonas maltophilia]MBN5053390.1 response regulator [Stenotrophomonas maltophilia]MBN5136808.1 response regulator [Stenotrophomonas maltophilia]MDJ1522211.1 response regulator [Stenotrophomonas maltophilia]
MINQVCYDCLSYPRILLVEHDVAIRESMQDVLKDSGYDITAVGDAEAAVERLAQQPAFDLLISDVGLPGMNGHDLAKHAMARHPSVTVLLVTGHGGVPGADPHFLENDVMLPRSFHAAGVAGNGSFDALTASSNNSVTLLSNSPAANGLVSISMPDSSWPAPTATLAA